MDDESVARKIEARTPGADISATRKKRLHRLCGHLNARGAAAPDIEDYRSFGSLSTLMRLQGDLVRIAPELCGPLRLAAQDLRREKTRRAGPQGHGGRRGPVPELSVDEAELPEDWRKTLALMRELNRDAENGMVPRSDMPPPPAEKSIDGMTAILRRIARTAEDTGHSHAISTEVIEAWCIQCERRGRASSGIALELKLLRRFILFRDRTDPLAETLARIKATYQRRASRERKRKEHFLRQNPTQLGTVLLIAERLQEDARAAPAASRERANLILHAAALVVPLVLPLRVSDLCRLRIGTSLWRDATRWGMALTTKKTGVVVERDDLWDEALPFLDDVLLMDSLREDLWRTYDARHDTYFFSRDGGATGHRGDWISDVWHKHVGTGAHIVRTLWHELASDSERDATWAALILCGQNSEGTAEQYRLRTTRKRAAKQARQMLRQARYQNL